MNRYDNVCRDHVVVRVQVRLLLSRNREIPAFRTCLPCPAGEVVARELLGIAYRPTWAGPCEAVPQWDEEKLAELSPDVRKIMGDPNTRVWMYDAPDVPPDLKCEAPGIDPSRWERE